MYVCIDLQSWLEYYLEISRNEQSNNLICECTLLLFRLCGIFITNYKGQLDIINFQIIQYFALQIDDNNFCNRINLMSCPTQYVCCCKQFDACSCAVLCKLASNRPINFRSLNNYGNWKYVWEL